MRKGVVVEVSPLDRRQLEAIAADRNSAQKHAWRARIVLLTGGGLGTVEIMRRTGKNGRHRLADLLRQSVFGRLAGYEDVNDALLRSPICLVI